MADEPKQQAITTRPAQQPTQVARTFGGETSTQKHETASDFVMAQAKAQIESPYVMAMRNPRSLDQARVLLLAECKNPAFAEIARYVKPIGEGIEGPSIRFVETAILAMTNIATGTVELYDDHAKRIVRVSTVDLERNVAYHADITIEKTVERNWRTEGVEMLGMRKGGKDKYGKEKTVFTMRASEDEMFNKQAAFVSKAVRSLGLRLIPASLVDEAMTQVYKTLNDENTKDPTREKKNIIDSFAELNVLPGDLADYLGHAVDQAVAKEIALLRAVYQAIRDGEATWPETIAHRREQRGNAPAAAPAAPPATTTPATPLETSKPAVATTPKRGTAPTSLDELAQNMGAKK